MIIPKKIAEWLERAKEDGVDYEVNKLRVLVFDDTEILEVIGDTYKECGINQSNISYCLISKCVV